MSASVSSSDEGCQIPQFDARPEAVLGAHGRVDFVVSDSSDDSRRRRSRLPTSTPPVAFEGLTTPSKRPPSPLTSQFQPSTKELGRDWMPPVGREDDSDSDTNTNERKRHTKLQNRNKRDRVEGEDESEEDDEDEDEVMDLQQENRKLEERCALLGRKADALEAALAAERMLHQDSVQLRAKTVKCTKCRDHDKALDRLRQEHATTATTAAAAAANLHTKLSSANDENKQLRSTLAVTRDSEASMRREMERLHNREEALKREVETMRRERSTKAEHTELLAHLQQRVVDLETRNRSHRREPHAPTTPITSQRSTSPSSVDRVQLNSAAEELKRAIRDAERRLQERERCASMSSSSVSSGNGQHSSQSDFEAHSSAVPLSLGALTVARSRHSTHASGADPTHHSTTFTPPSVSLSPGISTKSRSTLQTTPSRTVDAIDAGGQSTRLGYFRGSAANGVMRSGASPGGAGNSQPVSHPYEQ